MKLWIKYLIGCLLGFLAATVIPADILQSKGILDFLTTLSINAGRYVLIPLLLFSVTIAVCKLRETKQLLRVAVLCVVGIVLSTVLFTGIGVASVLLVKLPRIPISIDRITETVSFDIKDMILKLFPVNAFDALRDGSYLLPLLVFAGFAGAGCAADKSIAKPMVSVFDSLSGVCYIVLHFFTDMIAIGLIAISCSWAITYRELYASGTFNSLFLMLLVDFLIIAAGIYPLLLWLICKEKHPYKVLYASIGPIISAFFTGDTNFALITALRPVKESLGVKRRVGTVVQPVFAIFARGGAALTTTVSFVLILRSYSSMGISADDIMWICGMSILLSFILGTSTTGGTYTSIMLMCSMYGRGKEAGYLLLKPAMPVICAFAAAIDVVTMVFASYIIAHRTKCIDPKTLKQYI